MPSVATSSCDSPPWITWGHGWTVQRTSNDDNPLHASEGCMMVFRCLETCIQATWIPEFTTKSRRLFVKSCGLKRNSTRALLLVPTQNVKIAKGTNQSRKIWYGEITSKVHVTICHCPDFIDVFQQLHDSHGASLPLPIVPARCPSRHHLLQHRLYSCWFL